MSNLVKSRGAMGPAPALSKDFKISPSPAGPPLPTRRASAAAKSSSPAKASGVGALSIPPAPPFSSVSWPARRGGAEWLSRVYTRPVAQSRRNISSPITCSCSVHPWRRNGARLAYEMATSSSCMVIVPSPSASKTRTSSCIRSLTSPSPIPSSSSTGRPRTSPTTSSARSAATIAPLGTSEMLVASSELNTSLTLRSSGSSSPCPSSVVMAPAESA
mmetsp:Transcript_30233/g.96705  ORF Transcript_30233/g.96705 Transcript_30233/m.96705 type:complete len:217 (+) Transcript_30233:466-1116(+)